MGEWKLEKNDVQFIFKKFSNILKCILVSFSIHCKLHIAKSDDNCYFQRFVYKWDVAMCALLTLEWQLRNYINSTMRCVLIKSFVDFDPVENLDSLTLDSTINVESLQMCKSFQGDYNSRIVSFQSDIRRSFWMNWCEIPWNFFIQVNSYLQSLAQKRKFYLFPLIKLQFFEFILVFYLLHV